MKRETKQSRMFGLLEGEQALRGKSVEAIIADDQLFLHLTVIEAAMDLIDVFRQSSDGNDPDRRVVRLLGIRVFNALGAAHSLMLAGYYQNSSVILRDVLETVFLLDYFTRDQTLIERWRTLDDREREKQFKPFAVRVALDKLDGFTSRKREKLYKEFCALAAHPHPSGFAMLRPGGMDAHCGPFLDPSALEAVISEAGRLAVQAGGVVAFFMPEQWSPGFAARMHMVEVSAKWMATFYPQTG